MKTMGKRIFVLLLACVMLFAVCGCKGSEQEKKGGSAESLDDEVPVDLGGYEFTVVDADNSHWNKELSGTPYADAWIQILDEVETLYNCTITPTYVPKTETFTTLQPEIAAGGKYADIIITGQWQFGYFLGANLMMDLNELEVDWDHEWWDQDVRAMGTYGGKSYVGLGSFIFDTPYTFMLYYNEAIWNELGLPDPYKLVDDHQWTYEKFREYCRMAAVDLDNSGAMDTVNDRWGLVSPNGDFCRAWYFSLGGQYFKTDEDGKVKLGCTGAKTYDIIDRMRTMVKQDKTVGNFGGDESRETFLAGNSLFYSFRPGLGALKDMEDDWGAMPLPLYDESQAEYLTGVDHNSTVFGVASTNTDTHEVSVLLEALGRHAMILQNIFWPDYKETFWRHEEEDTRVMSEYIVGHGRHDLALLMQNCDTIFKSPMDRVYQTVYGAASADFASYVETVEDVVNTRLEDYFKYDAAGEETAEE